MQFLNTLLPRFVALFNTIFCIVQSSNAESLISVHLGKFIVLKYVPARPLSEIISTEDKSMLSVSDGQFVKASVPIDLTLERFMLFKLSQP